MGTGNNNNGRPFQKGGDPRIQNNAQSLSPEVKEIRKLSQIEFITRFNKYIFLTLAEVKELLKTKDDMPALDAIFLSAIVKTITTGDYKFIQECMDRIMGRPKQNVQIDPTGSNEPTLTPEEIAAFESELMIVFAGTPAEREAVA